MNNSHYSNYLISVQFDNGFVPDAISGKKDLCINFLDELGTLSRKSGIRLHASYSIVRGAIGYHAHFTVNWLPLVNGGSVILKNGSKAIARNIVTQMLTEHYFYIDNNFKAIKRVSHDKKYVTEYVIMQPKQEQFVQFSGFYVWSDFVPVAVEHKMKFYCSKAQFDNSQNTSNKQYKSAVKLLLAISVLILFVISKIMLKIKSLK